MTGPYPACGVLVERTMRRLHSVSSRSRHRLQLAERPSSERALEAFVLALGGRAKDDAARPTAFVFEEDADLRALILGFFESRSWNVVTPEASGSDQVCPALVVVDVRSSTAPGFHVLERILDTAPGLPVVVIASFGDTDVMARARLLGVRKVIEKPFGIEELESAIAM